MWNSAILMRSKRIWQNPSYQRLAIALVLSLLLHLFLIGKFYFEFPDLTENRQLIEAQLVLRKPELPKIQLQPTLPKPAFAPVKAQPVVKNTDAVEPVPHTPDVPVLLAPTELSPPQPTETVETINQVNPSDEEPAVESMPEEPSITINPNAYQYVETTFDVRTDIEASVDSNAPGKAKIVYELLPNGEEYQLKSLMEAKGLAALVIPDLLQTSQGFLSSTGLQPKHYLYQFGNNKNKTFSADFDWEQKQLNLHSEKGDHELALVDDTQDLLSFMYQFMFVPPLRNMQLSITNGKKLGIYDYSFEGEETIATNMGNLLTIHLWRVGDKGDEKTELWLALDYQYVPVKIRKTEKDGRVYEMLITSLKTEKPVN